jgi:hypothetical protein
MDSLWQPNPTVKQLRRFGQTVGAVLLLLGGILFWRHPERHIHNYLWFLGGMLVLAGFCLPRLLRLPYQLWMALAFVIGSISTRVILSATYLFAFTPVALLLRVLGKDPLDLRWAPGSAQSYWRDRETIAVDKRHLRPF